MERVGVGNAEIRRVGVIANPSKIKTFACEFNANTAVLDHGLAPRAAQSSAVCGYPLMHPIGFFATTTLSK
jgi:hypothetical protein